MKNPEKSKTIPALFGFAYYSETETGKLRLKFYVKKIFGTLFLLGLLSWTAGAGALYYHFKYKREYHSTTFWKAFCLPFRLNEHRLEVGLDKINEGTEQFKAGKLQKGFTNLRIGLAKYPNHSEARKLVAEIYLHGLKRPDTGLKLLNDGFEHGKYDQEYLSFYFAALIEQEEDKKLLELADGLIQDGKTPDSIHDFAALSSAQVHFLNEEYTKTVESLDLLHDKKLDHATQLRAHAFWRSGKKKKAINFLEHALDREPNNISISSALTQMYIDSGDCLNARKLALRQTVSNPLNIGGHIELLKVTQKQNNIEELESRFLNALNSFENDYDALRALASFSTDTQNPRFAELIYERAIENNFPLDIFAMSYIDALVSNREFKKALDFCQEIVAENPYWLQKHIGALYGLKSLAHFGLGENNNGKIYLENCLQDNVTATQNLVGLAQVYEHFGHINAAHRIISKAMEQSNRSHKILPHLVRIELAQGSSKDLPAHLNEYLKTRAPSSELLEKAFKELQSDHFLFETERCNLIKALGDRSRAA